jgi:integrase
MSFTLLPPGTRKGNKYWLARVTVDGRRHEINTHATNKAAARRFAEDIERRLLSSGPPRPGEALTFRRAAELYCEFRGIDINDRRLPDARRLRALNAAIGNKVVTDIRQATLVEAANQLAANLAPATRNREVIRPAASVLHYAASNNYCDWLRIKTFKEPAPVTRAVTEEIAVQLLAVAPDDTKRLLLLWLFHQGTRITQTLSITWDNISLAEQTFQFYDKKAQKWQIFPLHPEVFEELTGIPQAQRHGRLWPWTQGGR